MLEQTKYGISSYAMIYDVAVPGKDLQWLSIQVYNSTIIVHAGNELQFRGILVNIVYTYSRYLWIGLNKKAEPNKLKIWKQATVGAVFSQNRTYNLYKNTGITRYVMFRFSHVYLILTSSEQCIQAAVT
jgi:hypothetical protein